MNNTKNKKWRVSYWQNLHRTEWIIKAKTREEARKKFKEEKGKNIEIIQICETEETAHN